MVNIDALHARCRQAFKEMQDGAVIAPEETVVDLTLEHELYRCLSGHDFDSNNTLKPSSLDRHDLSLYASGPGLPTFDAKEFIQNSNGRFIGVARISATVVLKSEIDNMKLLHLKHDPFPDPEGNQHPNHVRLICNKGLLVAKEIFRRANIEKT